MSLNVYLELTSESNVTAQVEIYINHITCVTSQILGQMIT